MKSIILSFLICSICVISAFSRNDTVQLTRSFGMKTGGFVRTDFFYDTRQMFESVEGMLSLYPMPQNFDASGRDINAKPGANLVSIASRINTRFFAPDVLGAKASALIEIDFTGTSNTNGIRLRHAHLDFEWTKVSLLIGRTWHPLSNYLPITLNINLGAPFWVFNRSDQVRFNYRPGNWQFSATASYHSDYASLGPVGKSPSYLRNAIFPELTLNVEHKTPKTLIGIAGNTKTIKPRQFTTSHDGDIYVTDETLTTFTGQAYFQYHSNSWKIKAQSTYNQNMNESLMIGGYAVSARDPATGYETYTPTQYMNYWLNIVYGAKWQIGFFAGYLNSLGTLDNVTTDTWYARDPNIKYMYRLAPHLIYNINNWHFGIEFEYTTASYGSIQENTRGNIINSKDVGNFRTNLSVCFFL